MPKEYSSKIGSINDEKIELNIDRRDILSVFIGEMKELKARKINKGTYERVIIVATNVAEASITISSLRHVIDTGFKLSVIFNYDTLSVDISEEKITELQKIISL